MIAKLPKDRTFLNSGNPYLRDDVKHQGYNVLETSPEKAIEQVVGNKSE